MSFIRAGVRFIKHPKAIFKNLGQQAEAIIVRIGRQIIIEYKRSKTQDATRVGKHSISIGGFIEYLNYTLFESTIQGNIKEDSTKSSIIVVSHEASRTGAPILLNICKGSAKNIILFQLC